MINIGQVLGRVGRIDTTTTSTGIKVTNMSMVTSKKVVRNGQKEDKVTWHNVTAFSKVSEIAEKYVKKGDLLYIQGEMDSSKYVNSQGIEKEKHFIVAHQIQLLPNVKEHKVDPQEEDKLSPEFQDDAIPW